MHTRAHKYYEYRVKYLPTGHVSFSCKFVHIPFSHLYTPRKKHPSFPWHSAVNPKHLTATKLIHHKTRKILVSAAAAIKESSEIFTHNVDNTAWLPSHWCAQPRVDSAAGVYDEKAIIYFRVAHTQTLVCVRACYPCARSPFEYWCARRSLSSRRRFIAGSIAATYPGQTCTSAADASKAGYIFCQLSALPKSFAGPSIVLAPRRFLYGDPFVEPSTGVYHYFNPSAG